MRKPLWTAQIATVVIITLVAASCASEDSSGLATLADATTTSVDAALTAAAADNDPTSAVGTAGTIEADADADTDAEPDAVATEADELSDEELLLEFAACMRDHGVDFPDPIVEADGTITFGFRPGRGGADQSADDLQSIGRDPDLPAARDACSEIIEGRALGPGGQSLDEVGVENADRLLEFAQCMRDHGVDIGDPDPNAFGPGSGGGRPFGELDFDDADMSAAFEVCGEQLPFDGRRPGGRP
jgi:hypothetical protein